MDMGSSATSTVMSVASSAVTGMADMTSTASAMMAPSTHMASGGMSMGGADACKISVCPPCSINHNERLYIRLTCGQMLWNWYTVDACFLAKSWRIASPAMFAGSCLGVVLLVVVLEALRRAAKEYDAYLVRSQPYDKSTPSAATSAACETYSDADTSSKHRVTSLGTHESKCAPLATSRRLMPTPSQQALRALLHMLQFALAYLRMLIAMYYNGDIIICIFIGAYVGSFVFGWQSLGASSGEDERQMTYCCG